MYICGDPGVVFEDSYILIFHSWMWIMSKTKKKKKRSSSIGILFWNNDINIKRYSWMSRKGCLWHLLFRDGEMTSRTWFRICAWCCKFYFIIWVWNYDFSYYLSYRACEYSAGKISNDYVSIWSQRKKDFQHKPQNFSNDCVGFQVFLCFLFSQLYKNDSIAFIAFMLRKNWWKLV